MERSVTSEILIREARSDEHAALGRMLVSAYASLPGMPTVDQQPDYYATLADVAGRAARPSWTIFVAAGPAGDLFGSIDFIEDMQHYASGGGVVTIMDAAGVRFLAVNVAHRGKGAGKALTNFCITRARALGKGRLVLHTTRVMTSAWALYEGLGFVRFPEIDFRQGELEVFGFQLRW
jgi:GNAT superfamily N-acetyltransferase